MCSEQSATAEFTTDDEILAALRPTEVRTDRPEFTTDDELLAALNRNELALNSARATLDRENAAPLPAPQAMRWLSELRATTDFALSSRQVARPLAEVLIELHELGLREVLPNLPLPKDSQARPLAEANLGRQLVALRQATQADGRPERQPAPVVSGPEIDRGISL